MLLVDSKEVANRKSGDKSPHSIAAEYNLQHPSEYE
jgi:hypothetical protein